MNYKRLSKPNQIENMTETEYINDTQKGQMIKHFMAQVKTEDLLNVGFMKPIQVALRTSKHDKNVPKGTLPQGLMIALKDNGINDNKFKLAKLESIPPQVNTLDELRRKNLDNYISLLKKNQQQSFVRQSINLQSENPDRTSRTQAKTKIPGMELGICISMKNEDKKLLKKTLAGVVQNLDEMIRSGMSPDDMFVVVVMDGIANVDKSIFDYFEQFQRQSEIFIEDDKELTIKKKYEINQYHQQIQKEQPLNFSKFLFKPEEFTSRVQSKFQNIRAKYDEVVRIKKSIQNIKKENNKDNQNLKMILNKMIDKQKNIMKKIDGNKSVLINQQTIMKELATSEQECNQYISTRDELAYVSSYRVPTASIATDCKDKETKFTIQRSSIIQSKYFTQRTMDQYMLKNQDENSQDGQLTKPTSKKTIRYVNIFFCIKYKEEGKLSSHNWFFNGFCQELKPKYSVIIDVGVRPYPDAIFKMYRCMKLDNKIGSVCGYMRLIEQKVEDEQMTKQEDMDCMSSIFVSLFDIQRSQQVDNHFEHLVQKPFQSIFNFIHVLPGSFSGYNMNALRPEGQSTQLLTQYFKSIDDKITTNKVLPKVFTPSQMLTRILFPKFIWRHLYKIDPDSQEQYLYNENINLAEDRILCLEIHKNNKNIVFMPDVFAKVQPIKMINDYMEQKRIEINGGAFAFEKVREELTDQNSKRTNFLIKFQLFYFGISNFLTYFAPAILIFAFHFTFEIVQVQFLVTILSTQDPKSIGNVLYATITNIIVFVYALMLGTILFYSLHVNYKHKRFVYFIYLISTQLGIFSLISFLVYFVQTLLGIFGTNGDYLRKSYYEALFIIMPNAALFMVNFLRWSILSSIVVIIFPVLVYSIFFRKMGIIWDICVGIFSTIFYFPTQITLMPIYSKCKIDDIYTGAKGAKNMKMKQTWNILKYLEITKYFFWNAIGSFTLIILHSYILLKFFALLSFLVIFTLLQLIKIVPAFIYTISYKYRMMKNPLLPSEQQIAQLSSNNNFRVFDTIKRFEDDFRTEIQYSFELAAEEMEYENNLDNQIDNVVDLEGEQSVQSKPKIARLESVQFRPSRQSISIMNNFQGHKFNNMRESAAVKKNYYPFQFGGKKEGKPVQPNSSTLQMVLLKQKMGQESIQNKQLQSGQAKLKKYQNFRNTIKHMF